jgi:hypothetical protein
MDVSLQQALHGCAIKRRRLQSPPLKSLVVIYRDPDEPLPELPDPDVPDEPPSPLDPDVPDEPFSPLDPDEPLNPLEPDVPPDLVESQTTLLEFALLGFVLPVADELGGMQSEPLEPVVPEVPELPMLPVVPEVPELPVLPAVPEVPELPMLPAVPEVPELPMLPVLLVPAVPALPLDPVDDDCANAIPADPKSKTRSVDDNFFMPPSKKSKIDAL